MKFNGNYVIRLYKDGVFFADRTLNCSPALVQSAIHEWNQKGFIVSMIYTNRKFKGTNN